MEKKKATKKPVKKSIKRKITQKKKVTKKNDGLIIIMLFLTVVFLFSTYKVITWFIDNKEITKELKKIDDVVKVKDVKDNENTEIVNPPEEDDEFNPYWDYIYTDLMSVDFTKLKKENSDTVGWIKVNGTKVNYPFVQTDDNTYYLNHSFYKQNNGSGWVFLDYRNDIDNLGRNTILYAHARLNGTMFGSLKNILSNGWLNNSDNFVVKLSTESENTLWQVFSVYHIPTTNDYIKVSFMSDTMYMNFLNMLKDRSSYDFGVSLNTDDKILTLSTCYSESEKLVLHAKLIKREGR